MNPGTAPQHKPWPLALGRLETSLPAVCGPIHPTVCLQGNGPISSFVPLLLLDLLTSQLPELLKPWLRIHQCHSNTVLEGPLFLMFSFWILKHSGEHFIISCHELTHWHCLLKNSASALLGLLGQVSLPLRKGVTKGSQTDCSFGSTPTASKTTSLQWCHKGAHSLQTERTGQKSRHPQSGHHCCSPFLQRKSP